MTPISSRERMLTTIRHEEPDRVPLLFHTFGFEPPAHLRWSNPAEQAKTWLSLGADALLWAEAPVTFDPKVSVRRWDEPVEGRPGPLMIAEYDTPAGVFRQEVQRSDDLVSAQWPMHKDGVEGVQLLDDYNVPRYRRCPIETEDDLEKVLYLLHPLSGDGAAQFRERIAAVAREACKLGVLLVGQASSGTDAAFWLCGVEALLYMAIDRPAMFASLLDIIDEWDKRNVEILLDSPVDVVMRRGYYEGTSFWSPDICRRFFAPRIKELTDMTHQADRLMGYTMSVGVMPLLSDLVEIGYDVHYLLDPLPNGTRIDLLQVKSAWDGKIAVIGGLNTPITLEHGSPRQIRHEVRDAVSLLGRGGGLALTPAEAIFASTPWESIETVIAAWKEVRD